jgi:hypothetical protein
MKKESRRHEVNEKLVVKPNLINQAELPKKLSGRDVSFVDMTAGEGASPISI